VTNLHALTTPGRAAPRRPGPVFYQNEASPPATIASRCRGYSAAAAGAPGTARICSQTDGTTHYSLRSFDDTASDRMPGAPHLSGRRRVAGVTTDFPRRRCRSTNPVLPLASEPVTVPAAVFDREGRRSRAPCVTYRLNGVAQPPVAMTLAGTVYQARFLRSPTAPASTYASPATGFSP
jgi:hypothetical protein